MNANHLSEEIETRLKEFFIDEIDAKEMAKIIREINYTISLCSMRSCENVESGIRNIDDNFYYLNRLAEVLDPYLEVD